MAKYLEPTDFQKSRAYSPAVITQGGQVVWLAGQTGLRDEDGNDLSGNFEAQVRSVFRSISETLKRVGADLQDLVTMTVFINDARNGDKFVELRSGYFPSKNFPASAMITVFGFAQPGILLEIQGVACIDG
jgi:2-iminobutanoate/2-iminopropanoate deaminase